MSNIREDIEIAFNDWRKKLFGKSSDLYIEYITAFNAGVLYSEATLSTKEKELGSAMENKQTQGQLLEEFKRRFTYESGDGIRMETFPGTYLKIFNFFKKHSAQLESELKSLREENDKLGQEIFDLHNTEVTLECQITELREVLKEINDGGTFGMYVPMREKIETILHKTEGK